jgi:hypothetical protein
MEHVIQFRLTADTLDAIRLFAEETGADLGCRAVAKRTEDGFVIDAYLPKGAFDEARAIRRAGLRIEYLDDFSETSQKRRAEVSDGNRYANRSAVPRGLGVKE